VQARRGLTDRVLELAAGRVQSAHELIDALGKLRRTLDDYDWIAPRWQSGRSVGVLTSNLKLSLVVEFENVSTAARKVGGRKVIRFADELDAARTLFLATVDPPDDGGVPEEGRDQLRILMDGLRDAATKAAGRKRWMLALVAGALVFGVAVGFMIGVAARLFAK
jgi:hypothetical protein